MDLNELKATVSKAKMADVIEQQNAAIEDKRLKEEAIAYLNKFWMGKVRTWIENLDYLAKNGYVMTSRLLRDCYNIPPEQKCMCTDGVYHGFGIYSEQAIFGKHPTHVEFIGAMAGGACGDYDIVTDGNEWFLQRHSFGERFEISGRELQRVASGCGLQDFENRYNALMMSIVRKAERFDVSVGTGK